MCRQRRCCGRGCESLILAAIFFLSFLVKTYRIESGSYVVWDEAHFGKFARNYLKREFYFDVHPPLGKLMTALGGLISSQDTEFRFKSGEPYPETLDYCTMRRFHAAVSALIPLFTYGTMRELGYSIKWCGLFSLLYIFENGMTSISRLILLDSHLLLFTSCVLYSFARFVKRGGRGERTNMLLLGTSIGLVLSVKWIGCFTMLFVGIYIVWELYMSLKYDPVVSFARKLAERVLFLLAVPVAVYVFWFVVHFAILVNSSSDEAHMSSLFQLRLRNNRITKLGKYVEYGFPVTIKASKMAGGNLHSHNNTYPGTDENQVTTYHYKDENDDWAFQKVTSGDERADFLQDEDVVVLLHSATKRYLGAADRPAFMSDGLVVNCTAELTQLNLWRVEAETDLLGREPRLKAMTTRFRLFNTQKRCYLASSPKQYPEWGFGQGEVMCTKSRNDKSVWNIERNELVSPRNTEYSEVLNLKNMFFHHFIELNKAMLHVNSSFKQDKDLEPLRITSRPHEWFVLRRGLRMVSWDNDEKHKFYMFGNPFTWYLSSISVLAGPLVLLAKTVHRRRRGRDLEKIGRESAEVFIFFAGWVCHYVPFFFIGRVLYFHHYFPAMIFAILSVSYIIRHCRMAIFVCVAGAVCSFVLFSPLTYGFKDPKSVAHAKLLRSWDFV
ncbi:UNVERIFIED_CONTAM: hypothetical protein PYX00_011479 [Menopon gallinae]|uniref:Protein O-mannosyl-transferase 2 n=1 Tax=Menopon gallinae TaxID=328185 RepID=A0AAW2H7K1_9NEOP